MQFTQSTIIAVAGLLATGVFASPIAKLVQCTDGAVFFAVRGSDPNYAQLPVGMTNVANAIISKAGSGYLQAVAYPAIKPPTNNYADYEPSVQAGVTILQNDILGYVIACSTGKVFVMGYSQGAQVVDSALVTGVAVFADPMFVPNVEPIDQGSADTSSVGGTATGRQSTYAFLNEYFSTRLRSCCEAGDAFCNFGNGEGGPGGATAIQIHENEPEYYQDAATAWMTSLV